MKAILLLALLLPLCSAADHNGDGTFRLFQGQSIGSHTQYVVVLDSFSASGLPGGPIGNATFSIYDPAGALADTAVLAANATFDATYPGSGRTIKTVLSVQVRGFGYSDSGNGSLSPYATVKVSSASFGIPLVLNVTSVGVTPRVYDATIYWTTNDDANGTAYVYGAGPSLVNSTGDSLVLPSHELRVKGLSPSTGYTVVVEACDPGCVRSDPVPFTTLASGNSEPSGAAGDGVPAASAGGDGPPPPETVQNGSAMQTQQAAPEGGAQQGQPAPGWILWAVLAAGIVIAISAAWPYIGSLRR
jgi:hypothetical protein